MRKFIGGVLLIAGTCIGGGMLGLPIATAQSGVVGSSLLLIAAWLLMTFTALLTLEVNLCFPRGSNVISMAKATLGKTGEVIGWTFYLLFLYALVSAYIAGGQDSLHGLLKNVGVSLPANACGLLFVIVFGTLVMSGIRHIDLFNRWLMCVKLVSIFLLISLISLHVQPVHYAVGQIKFILPAIPVAVTSFGFSIIVPSLRDYFADDMASLRKAILLGSFLPLILYLLWNLVIFGLIPLQGPFGLASLMDDQFPISGLVAAITHYLPLSQIILLSKLFTSTCALTAFMCVSLGLHDYLTDGLNQIKVKKKWMVAIATFAPPLVTVILFPKAFILMLSVAGILCVILQAAMPAWMAWQCRYVKAHKGPYCVSGGKVSLIIVMFFSALIVLAGFQSLI